MLQKISGRGLIVVSKKARTNSQQRTSGLPSRSLSRSEVKEEPVIVDELLSYKHPA